MQMHLKAAIWVALTMTAWHRTTSAQSATASERWHVNFDDVTAFDELQGFSRGPYQARFVEHAPGKGRCLELATTQPGTFCALDITRPVTVERNLILAFDHREEIDAGKEGAYLGMSFYSEGKQAFWYSDTFSPQWRHVEVPITQLKEGFGVEMKAGLRFDRIQLYARSKDNRIRGDNPCNLKVWFDNIRLYTGSYSQAVASGKSYTCHNNPPLMDWRGPTAPEARLQLSRDPGFEDQTTVTVALKSPRPFYVPDAPLEPGVWYFRLRTVTELFAGWGPTEEVLIPEHTHHYTPLELDLAALAAEPHPRLLPRIRPDGDPVTDSERESRMRQMRTALKAGVPEHPGPYKEGDPRWPHWIDWYGSVADKTTARTGGRLRQVAETAILTRDAEAVAAAKTLLLAACGWAPEGGSAARYGDLQAASLLQGMVWCYDACQNTLTVQERERVHDIIKRRVLQFYTSISPFRINPAQNHPWKKTTIVAESALVMTGVLPEASEWLDTAVHVYAYRILPSMGFQGENQEGIGYWNYGVNMLANFADLVLFIAGVNLYDHPWLRQTCRFPMYCAPPDGYAISFADNSSRGNAVVRGAFGTGLVGLLGSRVNDPYALWYANRQDPDVEACPPADIPQSVFYPYIGYAIFNTCLSDGLENVAVGMRCGPYYAGHQHDDNNGFVIHAFGDKLAVDGGYYDWYGSPHFKAYSITTLAHNTLLVNGQCQKRGTDGQLASYFDSPGFGVAVGDAASNPLVYNGLLKRFERRLIFLKPGIVIVHDLVQTSGDPMRLDWLPHAHTEEAFPVDPATRTFRIERPAAQLDGTFLAPADIDLKVTRSFDIAPQKPRESVFLPWEEVQPEWTLTATPRDERAGEDFVAVMQIRRSQQREPAALVRALESDVAYACELRMPYGTYIVASRKRDAREGLTQIGGLETDAAVAAVLLSPDGSLINAFATDATRLRFRGEDLFHSAEQRSWAMDEGLKPETLHASLIVDGKPVPIEGRRHPLPDGAVSTWWATLQTKDRGRCGLTVNGWTGARPPDIRINGRTETATALTVALPEGRTCLTVTGKGTFERIELSPLTYGLLDAEELANSTVPLPGDIVIDTDAPGPAAESTTRGRVMNKVASTGGSAYCCIDGPVQWAEWTFQVLGAGSYEVLVRAASEHNVIERELRIDGEPFPAPGSAVRMRGTGGWCRETDDWAWYQVSGPQGKAAHIRLEPGKHTLHWEFVTGSQNVDVFVLRPVTNDR